MFKKEDVRKIPWGIIAGAAGMIVLFATVAFVLIYVVLSGVAAQTAEAVTVFENWYQTLIFVVDIIAFVVFAGSLTMWIMRAAGKLGGAGR